MCRQEEESEPPSYTHWITLCTFVTVARSPFIEFPFRINASCGTTVAKKRQPACRWASRNNDKNMLRYVAKHAACCTVNIVFLWTPLEKRPAEYIVYIYIYMYILQTFRRRHRMAQILLSLARARTFAAGFCVRAVMRYVCDRDIVIELS